MSKYGYLFLLIKVSSHHPAHHNRRFYIKKGIRQKGRKKSFFFFIFYGHAIMVLGDSMKAICIFINKMIYFLLKLFRKNGSVFPGSVVYKLNPHILEQVTYPSIVVGVTGSSGKGSTVDMIAHILEDAGYKICYNKSGSNGLNAAITLILNHCNLRGKMKCDILLMEMDERYLKLTFPKGTFTHMVVTNITRDQPARNAHSEFIWHEIFDHIDATTHLILNADDPLLKKVTLTFPGKITTYGVAKTKASYAKPAIECVDSAFCPNCHQKLEYSYYHYGNIGEYHCPSCDFARNPVDYEATKVSLAHQSFWIGDTEIHFNKNILYAVYYTLAAYVLCKEIGMKEDQILYALNTDPKTSKRGKVYEIDHRQINMLESKNENAVSYYQSLQYIKEQEGTKTVVLGFENVSRRYQYNDLSWLWDVEFELLCDDSIDKIICIGRFRYDVATRLRYANIPKEKIMLIDDLQQLIPNIRQKTTGDIYTMVCFDMTAVILGLLKEDAKHEKN